MATTKKRKKSKKMGSRALMLLLGIAAVLIVADAVLLIGLFSSKSSGDPKKQSGSSVQLVELPGEVTAEPSLAQNVNADGTTTIALSNVVTPVPTTTPEPSAKSAPQSTTEPVAQSIDESMPQIAPETAVTAEPYVQTASALYPHLTPSPENAAKLASLTDPDVVEGFLPVCSRCKTDRKVLAITIDDCNQPDNLKAMLSLIAKYDGRATIFPIGENVQALSSLLKAAHEQGFEIENHTWDHCGLYDVDNETLARQLWSQNAAVSEALGVEYQMHFLRPRGGDNRYDQRTHAYIRQLGYYGIAYWRHVSVVQTTQTILESVAPGNILLFHTTNEDLAQLRELVPKLHDAGYSFVTLNDLYGLPENETGALQEHTVPEPLPEYVRIPQTYQENDYLHDVFLIQQRLTELGFLQSNYNGFYGKVTAEAVAAFQQSVGINPDGVCGPETWNTLFPNGAGL